jgi:hypothetical protein
MVSDAKPTVVVYIYSHSLIKYWTFRNFLMVSLGLLRSTLGGTMFEQQRVSTQHTFIYSQHGRMSRLSTISIYMPSTDALLSPCAQRVSVSLLYQWDHLCYICATTPLPLPPDDTQQGSITVQRPHPHRFTTTTILLLYHLMTLDKAH